MLLCHSSRARRCGALFAACLLANAFGGSAQEPARGGLFAPPPAPRPSERDAVVVGRRLSGAHNASRSGGGNRTSNSSGGGYHCTAEPGVPQDHWSSPKRAWCCLFRRVGCSNFFQCHSGLGKFQKFWSREKQAWCCEQEQLGCLPNTSKSFATAAARKMPVQEEISLPPSPAPDTSTGANRSTFDCLDGLWDWQRWPAAKQQWCCTHKLRWCPKKVKKSFVGGGSSAASNAGGGSSAAKFDCHSRDQKTWSEKQKTWCCQEEQLGCPDECSVSCRSNGRSATCAERVAWIRKNKFGGQKKDEACRSAYDVMSGECEKVCDVCQLQDICPGNGPKENLDCKAGAIAKWSMRKKQQCCKNDGIACDSLFPPYDCKYQPPEQWTSGKQDWCCMHEGLGCPSTGGSNSETSTTTPAAPSSAHKASTSPKAKELANVAPNSSALYDCSGLERHEEEGWPAERVAECCMRHKFPDSVHCPDPSAVTGKGNASANRLEDKSTADYVCVGDGAGNRADWSSEKADWCCKHRTIACKTTTTTTSEPHDCVREYLRWRSMWSPEKAKWCCDNFGRGCVEEPAADTTTTVAELFDCTQDVGNWASSWSYQKASWCCVRHKSGCKEAVEPTTTTVAANYNCDDGLAAYWPPWKAKWCCKHRSTGCPTPSPGQLYTCEDNIQEQATWSDDQRQWCCLHYSRGCVAAPQQHYDCLERLAEWRQVWPVAKQEWCCEKQGLGCVATTTTQPYDCKVGVASWSTDWSDGKQAWCCLYEQIGCPEGGRAASATAPYPYDCEAGLFGFDQTWPFAKKEWCCAYGNEMVKSHLRDHLGCPSSPAGAERPGSSRLTKQTFQRKFRQLPEQLVQRLEKWLAPTLCTALALLAIAGGIRTFSRSSWARASDELWYYRGSSRVFRPLDLDAEGPERELLLELPDRMEQEECIQRC